MRADGYTKKIDLDQTATPTTGCQNGLTFKASRSVDARIIVEAGGPPASTPDRALAARRRQKAFAEDDLFTQTLRAEGPCGYVALGAGTVVWISVVGGPTAPAGRSRPVPGLRRRPAVRGRLPAIVPRCPDRKRPAGRQHQRHSETRQDAVERRGSQEAAVVRREAGGAPALLPGGSKPTSRTRSPPRSAPPRSPEHCRQPIAGQRHTRPTIRER